MHYNFANLRHFDHTPNRFVAKLTRKITCYDFRQYRSKESRGGGGGGGSSRNIL